MNSIAQRSCVKPQQRSLLPLDRRWRLAGHVIDGAVDAAHLVDDAIRHALLACSPGGIAEMAIKAKALRAGVAFVTAAHVTRFALVVLLTEPAYRLLARRRAEAKE